MSVEKMKRNKEIKDNLKNAWYTAMKPLANLVESVSSNNYEKHVNLCKNISDKDLMRKFAKSVVEDLVRNPHHESTEFIVFNKKSNSMSIDFYQRILYSLRNVSTKDRVLKDWYLHNEKAKLFYKENSEEMINYEKKLNKLLKFELEKLGASAEYEVHSGKDISKKHPDLYSKWLEDIGYEKTLVVKV